MKKEKAFDKILQRVISNILKRSAVLEVPEYQKDLHIYFDKISKKIDPVILSVLVKLKEGEELKIDKNNILKLCPFFTTDREKMRKKYGLPFVFTGHPEVLRIQVAFYQFFASSDRTFFDVPETGVIISGSGKVDGRYLNLQIDLTKNKTEIINHIKNLYDYFECSIQKPPKTTSKEPAFYDPLVIYKMTTKGKTSIYGMAKMINEDQDSGKFKATKQMLQRAYIKAEEMIQKEKERIKL